MSRLNMATRIEKSRKKNTEWEETYVCTGIAYKTVMLDYTRKNNWPEEILPSKKWKKKIEP